MSNNSLNALSHRLRGSNVSRFMIGVLVFLTLFESVPGQEKKLVLFKLEPAQEEKLESRLNQLQQPMSGAKTVKLSVDSNGCGPDWLIGRNNLPERFKVIANERTFSGWDTTAKAIVPVLMNFKPACDLHDFGYAGVSAVDEIAIPNVTIDFSVKKKSEIDNKFYDDLVTICKKIPSSNNGAREQCKGVTGALLYYEAVKLIGWASFDCNLNDQILTRNPPRFCTRLY